MTRPTIHTFTILLSGLFLLTAFRNSSVSLLIAVVLLFCIEKLLFSPLKDLQRKLEEPLSNLHLKEYWSKELTGIVKSIQKHISELNRTVQILEKQNLHLTQLFNHDNLTGLPNRLLTESMMKEVVGEHAVVHFFYIRILNLRLINDTLGRSAGDTLLLETGKRLLNCCTDSLYLGCTDGHKFIIIYSGKTLKNCPLTTKGQSLIKEIEAPVMLEDYQAKLSIAMGISTYPSNTHTINDLCKNASLAANCALPNSELNCMVYDKSMLQMVTERLNLEDSIAKAMENDEFVPFFQPKLDLATGVITGSEALIRWFSPNGIIMPGSFIPAASDTGLIVPITWMMLEKAGQAYRRFLNEGFDISISVNVPVQAILHTDFVQKTLHILEKTGMPPHRLDIEITEETLVADITSTSQIIEELQEYGIDVSVDDFGTGYSSLQYLKTMSFNTMKIDKAFLEGVPENKYDKAILRASVELGKALNLKIVVEGVETVSQWHTIKEIGCHELQGYVLSKPVSADDFIKLLHECSNAPVNPPPNAPSSATTYVSSS